MLSEDDAPKIDGDRTDWESLPIFLEDMNESYYTSDHGAVNLKMMKFAITKNHIYALLVFYDGKPMVPKYSGPPAIPGPPPPGDSMPPPPGPCV